MYRSHLFSRHFLKVTFTFGSLWFLNTAQPCLRLPDLPHPPARHPSSRHPNSPFTFASCQFTAALPFLSLILCF